MNNDRQDVFAHPTAIVDPKSKVGPGTKIWVNVQIREMATVGEGCIISKDVYIDRGVKIGNRVKIQNGVCVYAGVTIEDDVFVGPHAMFTNDRVPRAFNTAWHITETRVEEGASIGANATIVCGITLGAFCMIGAGSVVTRSVPPYTLVKGNPARTYARIDRSGAVVELIDRGANA